MLLPLPSFPFYSSLLLFGIILCFLWNQTSSTEQQRSASTLFAFEKFVCSSHAEDLLHLPFNISRADIRSIKIALMYKRAQILELFNGPHDPSDRKILTYFDTLWNLSELADDIRVKTICEVGFHKGLSSLVFLAANPSARLIVLDIVENGHMSNNNAIRGLLEMYSERDIIFATAGDFSHLLHRSKSQCNLLYIDNNVPVNRLRHEIERYRTIMHPWYHRVIVDGLDNPDRARVWKDLATTPLLNAIDIIPSRQFGCITWSFNAEKGRYGYDFDFHEQKCGMNMSAGSLGIGAYSLYGSSKRYPDTYYHQRSSKARKKQSAVGTGSDPADITTDHSPSLVPDRGPVDLVIETEDDSCGRPLYGVPVSGFVDGTQFTWHESLRKVPRLSLTLTLPNHRSNPNFTLIHNPILTLM